MKHHATAHRLAWLLCLPALVVTVAALAWSFFWERPPGVRGANPWSEQPGLALALWWMADTWRHAPLVALFVYGAARRADPRLREAAALDGAWRRDRFWHLTLPGLTPALLLALVFLLPSALSSFDIPYTLSRGGTAGGSENAALYAWQLLAGEQRAQGAAVATSLLLLCVTSGLILLGAVAPLVGRRR